MKIDLYGENWEPQQTIYVEKKRILVSGRKSDIGDDFKGYRYTVDNHLSGLLGYVEIVFWEIPELRSLSEPVADGFLEVIGSEDELIVEIFSFFPFGIYNTDNIPVNIQRSGVGKLTLDTVMHDLVTGDDIRNFYVQDPSIAFNRLLTHHRGFEELSVRDTHEYVYKRVV